MATLMPVGCRQAASEEAKVPDAISWVSRDMRSTVEMLQSTLDVQFQHPRDVLWAAAAGPISA